MPEKKIGAGTLLKQGATTLSQIIGFDPPKETREEVPATTLDSTVEETLPAEPRNTGELAFMQAWTPGDTNHQLLDTAMLNRTIDAYSIVWSSLTTPKTDSFSAWVKELGGESVSPKGLIQRRVVLKLTTAITRS
jgi:hypothetical protein